MIPFRSGVRQPLLAYALLVVASTISCICKPYAKLSFHDANNEARITEEGKGFITLVKQLRFNRKLPFESIPALPGRIKATVSLMHTMTMSARRDFGQCNTKYSQDSTIIERQTLSTKIINITVQIFSVSTKTQNRYTVIDKSDNLNPSSYSLDPKPRFIWKPFLRYPRGLSPKPYIFDQLERLGALNPL